MSEGEDSTVLNQAVREYGREKIQQFGTLILPTLWSNKFTIAISVTSIIHIICSSVIVSSSHLLPGTKFCKLLFFFIMFSSRGREILRGGGLCSGVPATYMP